MKRVIFILAMTAWACPAEYLTGGNIVVSGTPAAINAFYGWASSSSGPKLSNPDEFQRSVDYAIEKQKALLIVTGKDSCSSCSSFAKSANDDPNQLPMCLKTSVVNTYWRGNDTKTGPTACKAARDFIAKMKKIDGSGTHKAGLVSIGSSSDCEMAMYAKFEDGCEFVRTAPMKSSVTDFVSTYNSWRLAYVAQISKHKITAAARFVVRDTATARLEATAKTTSVSVPFIREQLTDKEEHDRFVATYPNGTAVTNALDWAAGTSGVTQTQEVSVAIQGWAEGKDISLAILDSNGNKIDTSAIHCVAGGNSFSFPDLSFDPNGTWGQWTLNSEATWQQATNKVHKTNSYLQADTNGVPVIEPVVMDIPLSPSNSYEVVYTNDIAFFADLKSFVSNWYETVDQPHVCDGTNRTFYVFQAGGVTNEDVSARQSQPWEGTVVATNFHCVLLTNAEHRVASSETTWTNFSAIAHVDCTNFYYTVTTNEYQYGAAGNEKGGRSAESTQSCILKVTGSAVWQAETVAFAESVLSTELFAKWCETNQVVTILEECQDASTGASLFSHAVAANGRSGSAFLSRNGLVASQCPQPPVSNVFEVALYRPDGTLAGRLNVQRTAEGVYGPAENVLRLSELLDQLDDLTETANDTAETTPLTAVYGRTIMTEPAAEIHTLQISDTTDVFMLSNMPPETVVSIQAVSDPADRHDGREKPRFSVWQRTPVAMPREIKSFSTDAEGNPVWKFAESETNGLYAVVTAWTNDYAKTGTFAGQTTFRYALTAVEAPEHVGTVGFTNDPDETFEIGGEEIVNLIVHRTGYTGDASATVKLVSATVPEENYDWICDGNGATNLTWGVGEAGDRVIPITLREPLWGSDVSNLVFNITSVAGATADTAHTNCTIAVLQRVDPTAKTGAVFITNDVGTVVWTKDESEHTLTLKREGVIGTSGKAEARGEVVATLSASGGATFIVDGVATNAVSWAKYRTGTRDVIVKMPKPNASGQQTVTVTIRATDEDGAAIQDATRSSITYQVMPAYAPEFRCGIDGQAVQYVSFNALAPFKDAYNKGLLEFVSADLISGGPLPKGLQAVPDENGEGLRIVGVPTVATNVTATYQMTFKLKVKLDDGEIGWTVKTMPVEVKINILPLGGDGTSESGAAIPGFAERRVWSNLPLTNAAARLCGLLNLSASPRGTLSARYTRPGWTATFAAAKLDNCFVGEGGQFEATAHLVKDNCQLDVSFFTDGRILATVNDNGTESVFAGEAGAVLWKDSEDGAALWQGRHIVAFPPKDVLAGRIQGVPTVTVNMSSKAMVRSGKATYAGTLADGRSFHGTTTLVPTGTNGVSSVRLPILWSSATDVFSAVLVLTANGQTVSIVQDPAVECYWKIGADECLCEAEGAKFTPNGFSGKGLVFQIGGKDVSVVDFDVNGLSGLATGTARLALDPQNPEVLTSVNWRGTATTDSSKSPIQGAAWYYAADDAGYAVRTALPVKATRQGN